MKSEELAWREHLPLPRKKLQRKNLSFDRPIFATWRVVSQLLGKEINNGVQSADVEEGDQHREMLGGLTIPGAGRLLSPEFGQLMDDVNFLRNRWTGHGGTISVGEAENRHIELKDKLSQLQALLGSGWGGLDLVSRQVGA